MPRVVIENLSKVFIGRKREQVWAVKDMSLTVEDRELLVLVGPSGCGKTTTLRMIAGLEDSAEGTIRIDNKRMDGVPPKDRDIAMVFQNCALYPHMTVFENLGFGLKLRKFPKPEIQRRVRETADLLGLTPQLDRKPKDVSGGECQRVALGRAMVRQPKVFLLDEPLSNLDAPLRAQMRTEIARLHARLGATMIYVTHDQVEAMTLGDRIAVMKEGVVQQVASPTALYNSPINLFVAGFIGSPPMNFFRGTILQKGDLFFAEQSGKGSGEGNFTQAIDAGQAVRLAGHVGKQVIFGIRPENIRISRAGFQPAHPTPSEPRAGSPAGRHDACPAAVVAKVELFEPMGSETYLHLKTQAHSFIVRIGPEEAVDGGGTVSLAFEMSKAQFFDPVTGLSCLA